MWFTQWQGNAIGRIAMDGSITEYSVPTAAAGPYLITEGPDGVMWFTEFQGEKIGRITMIRGTSPSSRLRVPPRSQRELRWALMARCGLRNRARREYPK